MKIIKFNFIGLMLFSIAIYAGEIIDESAPPSSGLLATEGQKIDVKIWGHHTHFTSPSSACPHFLAAAAFQGWLRAR